MTPEQITALRQRAADLTAAAGEFHAAADATRDELRETGHQITEARRAAWDAGKPMPDTSALEARERALLADIRRLCAEGNARAILAQMAAAQADCAEAALAREAAA